MDIEPPKGSKQPTEGPQYTLGLTRDGVHTQVSPGADLIPICLGPRGCLVPGQVPGLILSSQSIRIDPA